MLAYKFPRCTKLVKITLGKPYCQSIYTCGMWVDCTQETFNSLHVQYNNAFRMLLMPLRFCNALDTTAEAHNTVWFATIMRNRCTLVLPRLRNNPNHFLSAASTLKLADVHPLDTTTCSRKEN